MSRKGSYQDAKTLEEDSKNKNKNKNKVDYNLTCPLNGAGQYMNSCKVVQSKAKSMKATWTYARGGGGRETFAGAKKCVDESEEFNTLSVLYMAKSMKKPRISKAEYKGASNSDEEAEHYTFENLYIGADSE